MGLISRVRRAALWISTAWLTIGHADRYAVALIALCLSALVALACVLALGAAFAKAPARQRACLLALETVLDLGSGRRESDGH